MRDGDESAAPRIPIPGAAAHVISAALARMATHCGETALTISKERVAGGGYAYILTVTQPPARPAPKR